VDGPEASFLTIDPRLVEPGFTCPLSAVERRRLDADEGATLLWLAIVTILEGDRATVNLRAPVVINPASMLGCQALPPQSPYPLRHPIAG
jgi:flagellar assembly factor FliW